MEYPDLYIYASLLSPLQDQPHSLIYDLSDYLTSSPVNDLFVPLRTSHSFLIPKTTQFPDYYPLTSHHLKCISCACKHRWFQQ